MDRSHQLEVRIVLHLDGLELRNLLQVPTYATFEPIRAFKPLQTHEVLRIGANMRAVVVRSHKLAHFAVSIRLLQLGVLSLKQLQN